MDALLALLNQQVRAKAGMRTKPSVVIIGFQSVKTTQKGQRGHDAGKKIKGRGGLLLASSAEASVKIACIGRMIELLG